MKKFIFTISCLMMCLVTQTVWADLTINVTPEDMSGKLNLSSQGAVKIGTDRTFTVTIEISSSAGQKYEVKQKMEEPLRNEKVELDKNAVVFHTLPITTSGSLYADGEPIALDQFEHTLYSSSDAGDGATFIVAYSVVGSEPDRINAVGYFRGTIRYYVVPIRGSSIEDDAVLRVELEIAETEFKAQISTSDYTKDKITLSTSDDKQKIERYVEINLSGMEGKNYDIFQEVKEDFKDEKGRVISKGSVRFFLEAQKGQAEYTSYIPLEGTSQIYSSQGKTGEDKVKINFDIDNEKIEDLSEGVFTSKLEYTFKNGDKEETIILDIEVEIAAVFEIEVISEDGAAGRLFFRSLKDKRSYMKEFETREALVKVRTNLNKPYIVVQKLDSPFINKAGDTIPLELFTLRQEIDKKQSGEIVFSDSAPLELGNTNVFLSDRQGSSSEFKVMYTLKVAPEIRSGDYFTNLSYSLTEK
ncbi:MAG: hypothetical protein KKF54_06730 [Candidatus Omnitrophica bacterium]|nr:hypothetical protein [Candidatus Omnitrophota bacterium]